MIQFNLRQRYALFRIYKRFYKFISIYFLPYSILYPYCEANSLLYKKKDCLIPNLVRQSTPHRNTESLSIINVNTSSKRWEKICITICRSYICNRIHNRLRSQNTLDCRGRKNTSFANI